VFAFNAETHCLRLIKKIPNELAKRVVPLNIRQLAFMLLKLPTDFAFSVKNNILAKVQRLGLYYTNLDPPVFSHIITAMGFPRTFAVITNFFAPSGIDHQILTKALVFLTIEVGSEVVRTATEQVVAGNELFDENGLFVSFDKEEFGVFYFEEVQEALFYENVAVFNDKQPEDFLYGAKFETIGS